MASRLPPTPSLPKTPAQPTVASIAKWDTDLLRMLYRLFSDLYRTINQMIGEAEAREPLSSIAEAPSYKGQIAVVGSTPYIATGTSSTGDWKEIDLV